VTCSPKTGPGGMRVSEAPRGQETNHEATHGRGGHRQAAPGRGRPRAGKGPRPSRTGPGLGPSAPRSSPLPLPGGGARPSRRASQARAKRHAAPLHPQSPMRLRA
jgi:hypothetical protein